MADARKALQKTKAGQTVTLCACTRHAEGQGCLQVFENMLLSNHLLHALVHELATTVLLLTCI